MLYYVVWTVIYYFSRFSKHCFVFYGLHDLKLLNGLAI